MVATLFQRPGSTVDLVEAGAPLWAQRMALKLLGFFIPRFPTEPVRLWTANFADLPLPAEWVGCQVWVRDKGKVGVSNGAAWVTTDGGAL